MSYELVNNTSRRAPKLSSPAIAKAYRKLPKEDKRMSDKTATERLRELLDERGVEYETDDAQVSDTEWYYVTKLRDGYHDRWIYEEPPDCDLLVSYQYDLGAEDAIAATLGNERLTFLEEKVKLQGDYIDKLAKEKNALFAQGCEAATRHAGQIDAMQRKLEAATLGRGTCRVEKNADDYGWYCECGNFFPPSVPPRNFCPNCGRKVVDE